MIEYKEKSKRELELLFLEQERKYIKDVSRLNNKQAGQPKYKVEKKQ